ncbi:MAG: DUF4252 domain-containing protein [Bacteroidales bacterium]|nr:DUF4252 domain-containing protein [Bacteroidales bacterium]
MKRFFLIISILLPLLGCSCNSGNTETEVSTALAECGRYDGAIAIKLGRTALTTLKGVVRVAGIDDPDVRKAIGLVKDIRGLSVLTFDDCSAEDKSSISHTLERALDGSEMLLEAIDSGEKVRLYGRLDDDTDIVRDIVVYVPSSCVVACISGSVSMETLARFSCDD